MDDMTFAVNLGGGLYMDSNGVLHQTVPPGIPVYRAPFALPVDPNKVKSALAEIKKFLADANDPKNRANLVLSLGVPLELFDLLSGIGKVAGVIAPYIAAIAIAYDCLRIFGVIKDDGDTALQVLVNNRFNRLENYFKVAFTILEQEKLIGSKNDINTYLDSVESHVKQLRSANPSLSQLEGDRNRLLGAHDTVLDNAVTTLLEPITWFALFDRGEHTRVWPYMQGVLYVLPPDNPAPVPAPMPPEPSSRFDHRLMIPLSCYAAEAYLACIRGISPEYRTTGDFRPNLRRHAKQLDELAKNMLTHVLAKTIYRPEDFSGFWLRAWEVNDPSSVLAPLSNEFLSISSKCNRWPVGAMDLRYHNDAFFGPFLDELAQSDSYGTPHPTKYGSLDLRWMPPAKLERFRPAPGENWAYKITNPEECAAAANEQSEKDYADLLISSGLGNLLQLAALFRNEATEPAKSQTVQGDVFLSRHPETAYPVTVQSEPIIMTGTIQSPATRQPQECSAVIDIWTQSLKRANPVEYTIKLRTLNSITQTFGGTPKLRWRESDYKDFQWTQYDEDLDEQSFLKLAVINGVGVQVDEYSFLPAQGTPLSFPLSSPRERIHLEGFAELNAHTFDWWIPLKPFIGLEVEPERAFADLRGAGWTGPLKSRVTLGGGSRIVPLAYDMSGSVGPHAVDLQPVKLWNGEQDWEGEHRDVAEAILFGDRKMIKLDYTFDWNADRLRITLKNRPSDRNYVVFVVVEEKLVISQQVLHTAMMVPINGQLTYVPQKFFDEEREAKEKFANAVKDFNDKYSKSRTVGRTDPIFGWVRPGDVANMAGLEQIVRLAQQHEPELLGSVMAQHGITAGINPKS